MRRWVAWLLYLFRISLVVLVLLVVVIDLGISFHWDHSILNQPFSLENLSCLSLDLIFNKLFNTIRLLVLCLGSVFYVVRKLEVES